VGGVTDKDDIAAVVIAYRPGAARLNLLVQALLEQCHTVLVMDNGGGRTALDDRWLQLDTVRCVDMQGNAGLGAALNRGFELGREMGVTHIVTFDQDSLPPPGMIAQLAHAYRAASDRGVQLAAVGPRFIDHREGIQAEYPFLRVRRGWVWKLRCPGDADAAGLVEADFLITSGCMIALTAYDAVGAFDVDFFVDCTDMEWGFRATSRGYRLFGVCAAVMSHELGTGTRARVMGFTMLGYSPVRRYYYARNNIRLLWLSYLAPGWKIRLAVAVLVRAVILPFAPRSHQGLRDEWRMFLRGVRDGLRRVGGPVVSGHGD
jgi:rhamnosyltransferase